MEELVGFGSEPMGVVLTAAQQLAGSGHARTHGLCMQSFRDVSMCTCHRHLPMARMSYMHVSYSSSHCTFRRRFRRRAVPELVTALGIACHAGSPLPQRKQNVQAEESRSWHRREQMKCKSECMNQRHNTHMSGYHRLCT